MYDRQEESKVFILGFSGTEIYYSTSERRILSGLSASLEARSCTAKEQVSDEEPSSHESD